ncbi:MAG: hypothetical protein KDC66_14125 [Phaeodactylibacter sp.]|nr:hypothetical protein [Phaeodactylibacter sp.]MCB9275541.1 hypothetical protein [Lewinellaceae bacterium]
MKKKLLFSKQDLGLLPLGFQFIYAPKKVANGLEQEGQRKPKMIRVGLYQTDYYRPAAFCKPISKIFGNVR